MYREVNLPSLTEKWTSPTRASPARKAPRCLPSRRKFRWSGLSKAQPWSRPERHRSWLPMMNIQSRWTYESMPSTNDYWLHDILYRACTSTAWRPKRAQECLNFVSLTVLKKLMCQMSTNETTRIWRIWAIIMDGYDLWRQRKLSTMASRQRKLPSMPSHVWKLYYLDDSDNELRWDTSDCSDGRWNLGSKVEILRRDHLWMFRVSLFSPSFLSILAGYKWGRPVFLPPSQSDKWRWSFPMHRIHQKVTLCITDRLWDLWVRTIAHVEQLLACFHYIDFLSYSCTGLCTPRGLHLNRGII